MATISIDNGNATQVALDRMASHADGGPAGGSTSPPGEAVVEQMDVSEPDATANEAEDESVYPKGPRLFVIGTAMLIALALVGLDGGIITTAIPSITNEFRTINDVAWYLSGYRLTLCAFQFMFGKLYSVFSIKPLFLVSMLIFEAGSLLCGLAPSSTSLVAARAIAGFGSAGLVSGIFTLVTRSVPLRLRPIYGGLGGAAEMLMIILGPIVGGIITGRLGWRWCFLINVPPGVVTAAVMFFLFREPQANPDTALPLKERLAKLDLFGTALFVPSMVCLILGLQWGGTKYGWGDARIIVLMVLCAVLVVLFAFIQWKRQDDATLPPRIIMQRSIISGMWYVGCLNGAMACIETYLSIYYQSVKQYTPAKSGLLLLPTAISAAVAAVIAGPGTSLLGFYTPFVLASSILMPIGAGLLTTLSVSAPTAKLVGLQLLIGGGAGIGFQGPQLAAQTVLSQRDAPVGLSAVIFAQIFGPTLSVAIAQAVFTNSLAKSLARYAPGVDGAALQTLGLSDLSSHVNATQLPGTLRGFDEAVTRTLLLPLGLTCAGVLGAVFMEWKPVKKRKQQ